jgi:hypothetical protein
MSEISQKELDALWDSVADVTPYSSYLNENTVKADDWIDTGSMVLNAIVSGSMYGGIPRGRVTQFAGPSQCLTKNQKLRVYKMRTT